MTHTETTTEQTNLKQLIGQLVSRYQAVAVQQNSFFINDVPQDLYAATDEASLTAMMGSLLYIIARCSNNSCLHINSTCQGEIITVSLKDNNAINNYAVLYEFQHLKILAQPLRGFLDINTVRNKETIISFSFENTLSIASNGIIRELKRA